MVYLGIKEELRKIGLTKYEAKAYMHIISAGISDAKTICKQEEIPQGKIYETLSTLQNKKFIDVQNTRPKKYRAIKISKAFDSFYDKKKKELEKELYKTKESLTFIGENLSNKNKVKNEEYTFWKFAFKKNILKMTIESFENADKEINVLLINSEDITGIELNQFSEELVKLINKVNYMSKKGFNLRILKNKDQNKYFTKYVKNSKSEIAKRVRETKKEIYQMLLVFDNETILIPVTNPLNKNDVLAMIKIWNSELAKDLNQKFMKLWKTGNKVQ